MRVRLRFFAALRERVGVRADRRSRLDAPLGARPHPLAQRGEEAEAYPHALAAHQVDQVAELGEEELLHRELDRGRRAGERDDDLAARHTRDGARQHGRRAHLLVREHAEELAEPVEAFLEEARDRLVGRVAGREPRAPVDDHGVQAWHAEELLEMGAEAPRVVGQDGVGEDAVLRLLEERTDAHPARVALGGARVAHRDDGAHGVPRLRLVMRVMQVRPHRSPHHARQRLDLGRARRAAALADVLVLLAVEQHEEEALAHRHRLAAAGTVEQGRLERAIARGRARGARRAATEHAPMVSPERGRPQRRERFDAHPPRLPARAGAAMNRLRPSMPTVYIEPYGCQMNVADTELMLGPLSAHGYTRTDAAEVADVILLNTCAIREHAEVRVLSRLGELARHKRRRPDVRLGVTGCMAQHLREKLARRAPWVDLLVGPDGYRRLPELLRGG